MSPQDITKQISLQAQLDQYTMSLPMDQAIKMQAHLDKTGQLPPQATCSFCLLLGSLGPCDAHQMDR